jgi:glycosyltransferase involved in cell wall biosynthesis
MRILFTIGDSHLPQKSGGAQSSTDQLATGLLARGHAVAVMCRLEAGGWTELGSRIKRRIGRTRFSRDAIPGYPVFRAWDPTDASEVVRRFRPDVAVVQNGDTMAIARSLESEGVPVVLYFRDVEFDKLGGNPADLSNALYVANSAFTARRHREAFDVTCAVIPPLVDAGRYRTSTTRANVTFINPYPVKGLDVALALAEGCPDIPFVFVESWSLSDEVRAVLDARLAKLPNVTLRPRTGDMRSVYGEARILLAPSRWEEAWGRVATEAHCSGIPVVGSRQGGLPEAIGPGGVTLDIDAPIADWVAAVRRLWDDEEHYARLSAAALAYSNRPEMRPEHQLGMLTEVLRRACAGRSERAA